MKLMRLSWFNPDDLEPITAFFGVEEGADPDKYRDEELAKADEIGVLAIVEISEVEAPAGADEALIQQIASQRWLTDRKEVEKEMAMLYYFDAQMLFHSARGGVISTAPKTEKDLPRTLERDDIVYVLERLCKHPRYGGQTIMAHTKNMELVGARDGEILDLWDAP